MGSKEKVFRVGSQMQLVCVVRWDLLLFLLIFFSYFIHIFCSYFVHIFCFCWYFPILNNGATSCKPFQAQCWQDRFCRNLTEPPAYVFWFHNTVMINYGLTGVEVCCGNQHWHFLLLDSTLRYLKTLLQVTVSGVESGNFRSTLTIRKVELASAGNYSCQPSMVIHHYCFH